MAGGSGGALGSASGIRASWTVEGSAAFAKAAAKPTSASAKIRALPRLAAARRRARTGRIDGFAYGLPQITEFSPRAGLRGAPSGR
jgi:hypothetical protein